MKYLGLIKEMYQLIGSGKMLDAFEKYYHEEIIMVEATGQIRKGKKANREYEENFVKSIKTMHDGGVKSFTSNEEEGITMVETWMDVTFGNDVRTRMEEVAVQRWKDDKIVHERFYYNAG